MHNIHAHVYVIVYTYNCTTTYSFIYINTTRILYCSIQDNVYLGLHPFSHFHSTVGDYSSDIYGNLVTSLPCHISALSHLCLATKALLVPPGELLWHQVDRVVCSGDKHSSGVFRSLTLLREIPCIGKCVCAVQTRNKKEVNVSVIEHKVL